MPGERSARTLSTALRCSGVQRFFFHIHNGVGFVADKEGQDCPDLDSARARAMDSIRAILAEEIVASGAIDLRGRIDIVDEAGTVTSVAFTDAIELRGGR